MKVRPHFGFLTFLVFAFLAFLWIVSVEMTKVYIEEDGLVPLSSRVHVPGIGEESAPIVRVVRAGYDYRRKKRWRGDGIAYLHKTPKDEPVGPFPYDVQVVFLDGNGTVLEVSELRAGEVRRPSHAYSGFIALKSNRFSHHLKGAMVYETRSGTCYPLSARSSRL